MARGDFRLYKHDETPTVYFPLASGASFEEGEPVVFSSGALTEAGDDPSFVAGVAATRTTDIDGDTRAAGTPMPVHGTEVSNRFTARNFATDGAGTAATPTQANAIGQLAGFTLNGDDWYVDTGTANLLVFVEDVLDARGRSIADPIVGAGTGAAVVWRFLT